MQRTWRDYADVVFRSLSSADIKLSSEDKHIISEGIKTFFEALRQANPSRVPGHGLDHTFRVLVLSVFLWSRHGGDLRKIVFAALFHDIIATPKEKHAELSAEFAEKFLRENGFESIAKDVSTIIREHSFRVGARPSSIESAILQDADRLDALGAIGVARVFSYSGFIGRELYDFFDPPKRGALGHFYEKIINLPKLMNTDTAKKLASLRVSFVEKFLDVFLGEIYLKDLDNL